MRVLLYSRPVALGGPMRNGLLVIFSFLSVSICNSTRAQGPNPSTGFEAYDTYQGGQIDRANLNNGQLYVHIPLLNYPQRGGVLTLSFALRSNSKGYYIRYINFGPSGDWFPAPSGGSGNIGVIDDQAPHVSRGVTGKCG